MRLYVGNILNLAPDSYRWCLAYQVSCDGNLSTELAAGISSRYPDSAMLYRALCDTVPAHQLLGTSVLSGEASNGCRVGLLFGQLASGNSFLTGRPLTEPSKLLSAMRSLMRSPDCPHRVFIPWGLGCGRSGGNWDEISSMLDGLDGSARITCVANRLPAGLPDRFEVVESI